MSKILKPYTIIPSDLYVLRDADRQVKNIIKDMGRPGYVLVSRQMGKTNLLLNAKRILQNEQDAFVYIDLSTPFETAKSCFENIIDIAAETNIEKFSTAYKSIIERRKELKDTPPHKQHVNELRILLKSITGKIVIILDEIDALTKTSYSDQVFSQIRSVYFTRTNYSELENLTYILSGVVEPTDIIKDPKISPFNIGQKIFLNDFTKHEFDTFLSLSKLSVSNEVKERIYFWSSGNPRMTWDVCSEIENQIAEGNSLYIDDIDKTIKSIYLSTFDKPPIDNIREIVINDREIRNAIIEIEYKKGATVNQRIKNKLYLAGIINYEEDDIHLKNEIIRQSLSLEWLKSLEEEEKGLINIAMEEYRNLQYSETLQSFEKFLLNNTFSSADEPHYYYIMGHCAYTLAELNKALKYFELAKFNKEDEAIWYFKVLNQKGLVYFYLSEYENSLNCYKEIIYSVKNDEIFAQAVLNYGSILFASAKEDHLDESKEIFQNIIAEKGFDFSKMKAGLSDELKTIAYYNLGNLLSNKDDLNEAIGNFKSALLICQPNVKPKIKIRLLDIAETAFEKEAILNEIFDLIITEQIKPADFDLEKSLSFVYEDFDKIISLAFTEYFENVFIPRFKSLNQLTAINCMQRIFDVSIYNISKNIDPNFNISILNKLNKEKKNEILKIDASLAYRNQKFLCYTTDINKDISIYKEYAEQFEIERFDPVDFVDLFIFANLSYTLFEKKKYQDALKYIGIINNAKDDVAESLIINYLVIYNLELQIHTNTSSSINSIEVAKKILILANDEKIKTQNSNLLGETGFETIKKNAESILNPNKKNQPFIRIDKVYGRNEIVKVRYRDGVVIETKYKKVEDDIKNGECFILS